MTWKSLVGYDCSKTKKTVTIVNGLSVGTCEIEDCGHECRYNKSITLSIRPATRKNRLSSVGAVVVNSKGGFVVGGHCVSRTTVIKIKNVKDRNPAFPDHNYLYAKEAGVNPQTVRIALRVIDEFKKEGVAIA